MKKYVLFILLIGLFQTLHHARFSPRIPLKVLPFTGGSLLEGEAASEIFTAELCKRRDLSVSFQTGPPPSDFRGYELSGKIYKLGSSKFLVLSLIDKESDATVGGSQRSCQTIKDILALAPSMADEIFTKSMPLEEEALRKSYAASAMALLTNNRHIDARDKDGNTLLHLALMAGYNDVAQCLLEEGADPNIASGNGNTPLMLASGRYGSDALAALLLKKGADVGSINKEGESPLFLAVSWGREETVKLLIENKADPNLNPRNAHPPLLEAVQTGQSAMVLLLLSVGADINIKTGLHGTSALMKAARLGQREILQILLKRGADMEAKDAFGMNALLYASYAKDPRIMEILILKGAALNEQSGLIPVYDNIQASYTDVFQTTALIRECAQNRSGLVRLLLKQGAKPNLSEESGLTALMEASRQNNEGLVRLLLAYGASPSLKTIGGLTAEDMGSPAMAALISSYKFLPESAPLAKEQGF